MENEKIFDLMTKMYADLKGSIDNLASGQNDLKKEMSSIKTDVSTLKSDVKKIDINLEELDKKVDLSLEGHKTNTEQLNRIETEVSKHEEIILRRVK